MIDNASIIHWRNFAPWGNDAQVEQDLIISRAIIDIFKEPILSQELAFRGGTALQKLFYPQATRYSEDLDFVQINSGGIGPILDGLRTQLDPWLGKPVRKQSEGRITLIYRYERTLSQVKMRLKIEINTREHFTVLGLHKKPFEMKSPWYTGNIDVNTYYLEELLGTKLRALYQRKKGRDLFDLSIALKNLEIDRTKIIKCFEHYTHKMGLRISRAEFEENLALKSTDLGFRNDIQPLLSEDSSFKANFDEDLQIVKDHLIQLFPGEAWKGYLKEHEAV